VLVAGCGWQRTAATDERGVSKPSRRGAASPALAKTTCWLALTATVSYSFNPAYHISHAQDARLTWHE
jgi:hypothetical protein